jgi:hypothetical protein
MYNREAVEKWPRVFFQRLSVSIFIGEKAPEFQYSTLKKWTQGQFSTRFKILRYTGIYLFMNYICTWTSKYRCNEVFWIEFMYYICTSQSPDSWTIALATINKHLYMYIRSCLFLMLFCCWFCLFVCFCCFCFLFVCFFIVCTLYKPPA